MTNANTADAWLAGLLVAALLTCVGVDARTRLVQTSREAAHSGVAPPAMSLVAPLSSQTIAGAEIFEGDDSLVELENFGPLEFDGRSYFRHAYAPASVLLIRTERRRVKLRLRFYNLVAGQDCQITCNDQPLATLANLPVGTSQHDYALDLRPGELNRLIIAYVRPDPAGPEPVPTTPDARPLAGTFFELGFDFFD